ncbi:MAG: hypothetical protein ACI4D8_05455 [Wujia sp.]
MGEWIRQLPKRIVEFWNKYTTKQKALFLSIAAAVLITIIALVVILNRTSYTRLASFDDSAATAQAANLLDENGITYKVSKDALSIDVDEKQISEARLLLGQNGISSTVNNTGTDWLFDNGFNTTDSEKRLKAKINLQSTMAMDISNIEGVTKATVTIDLPDNTNSIYSKDAVTSVSIMLTTNGNFSKESVQGIAEYAKTCVGDSDTNNITIIDNQGNLLFSGTNSGTTVSAILAVQQQIEEYYSSKLWNLMVNSGVYDEVSVSANLSINLSEQEVHNIEYYSNDEDDTGPLQDHYYYVAENTDGTGGIVGTDANGEEITDYNLLDTANGESTLTILKQNYAVSSTETYTVTPVGKVDLTQSSIGLYLTRYKVYNEAEMKEDGLLDDMTFAEFKAANSEIIENTNSEEIVTLLSNATGIKENKIYVVERIVPLFYPEEAKQVPIQSIISIVLAVIIGLLLLFVVFKGMKTEEVVEVEPELSVEALLATTKENQTLDDIEFSDKSATKAQIEKFVDENPEAVAALLRNWLNDDWE